MGSFDDQADVGFGATDQPDDLDLDLAERLQDPQFAAAFEDAAARSGFLATAIERRKSANITQQVVAQAMDTTQSAISELEGGATDPRLSTLQRYARAIGCRLDLQLCNGDPSSGWRRLGADVHYSSHEHRISVPLRRSPEHWGGWDPGHDRWTKHLRLVTPTSGEDPWTQKASAAQ